MRRIAVVDDQVASTLLLRGYLKAIEDVDVTIFSDPVAALSWCAEYEPDLILLDYMMPELDGLAFMSQVRGTSRLKDTPVIMITGDNQRDTLYATLEYGTTDFLRKPVDRIELLARTRNFLELRTRQRELKIANRQLSILATTDTLTGLKNRRWFYDALRAEVDGKNVCYKDCSVAIIDLDKFKSINDAFGHDGGDRVLRAAARVFSSSIRPADLLGRIGGEEFGVIFPNTHLDEATDICLSLLDRLRAESISIGPVQLRITASIGVAMWQGAGDELDSLMVRADEALYVAKSRGRNRVQTWQQSQRSEESVSDDTAACSPSASTSDAVDFRYSLSGISD